MASGRPQLASAPRRPWFLRRRSPGDVVFDLFNGAFLIAFCFTVLYPFWSTILLSFSNVEEATSLGIHLWIREWHLTAYQYAMSDYGSVPVAYANSVFRALSGTFFTLVVTVLAAYPMSKKNLPARKFFKVDQGLVNDWAKEMAKDVALAEKGSRRWRER